MRFVNIETEMNRVNKPNKDGNIVIDFDGNVITECKIENGSIIVERAMDGRGNKINIE